MQEKQPGTGAKAAGLMFDRMLRLVGAEGLARLRGAHVMVIGCGGVGSWAAEGVARSAVGHITLIDFDKVCVTNFNRQVQAVSGAEGRLKVEVLAERLRLINPAAVVETVERPFCEETHAGIMACAPDFVIDAIDNITSKCFLINYCRSKAIPMVTSTGSAGRLDPTLIRIEDLGRTRVDPLARAVRQILRAKYGFPAKGDYGVQAVCSIEESSLSREGGSPDDHKPGFCPGAEEKARPPVRESVVLGTAGFVTGAFGFACASAAVRHISGAAAGRKGV